MTIDEMITVLQAAKEGKLIQCREKTDDDSAYWTEGSVGSFVWNFNNYDYRVKPEPMELDAWLGKDGKLAHPQYHCPEYDWVAKGYVKKKFREVIE